MGPTNIRGAGVLFHDASKTRVLVCRRSNTPTVPFPGWIDILGGYVESGETPEKTVIREMAEELDDLRTGTHFILRAPKLFMIYTDEHGVEHHIFYQEADFDIADVRLNEGQCLLWLTEAEAASVQLAFGFEKVVRAFFRSSREDAI